MLLLPRWRDYKTDDSGEVEVKDLPEDGVTEAAARLGDVAQEGGGGQVEDVAEVRVGLPGLSASLGMTSVLPPDLDLLPGKAGHAAYHLHLLHREEGQVVEPPAEDGHCLPAVWPPALLAVPLTLRPGGEGGGQRGGQRERGRGGGRGLRPLLLHNVLLQSHSFLTAVCQ